MGFFDRIINRINPMASKQELSRVKLVTTTGTGMMAWNGKLYRSDIVRSAIRPKANAIGKMTMHHVRGTGKDMQVNPDGYMKFLLSEPNPYMSGQKLIERLITTLELNGNAFALIMRDANGYPIEIYPISATTAEAVVDKNTGKLSIKFTYRNGGTGTFDYEDIIHLRHDYGENDFFGTSPMEALAPVMEVMNASDQSIVQAVKNSSVIRWIMKFSVPLRPDDQKKAAKDFAKAFLDESNNDTTVATTDTKADLERIEPKDYVPNAEVMNSAKQRVYGFFNTNDHIVNAKYSENEWLAYYESSIEPDIVQISQEFTRKLFSRRERALGNRIICEAASLTYASIQTKLSLINLVDRGIMTPNEIREILALAPVDGGDIMVRRLDTAPVSDVPITKQEGGNS